MAVKKRGLGRGLDALLGGTSVKALQDQAVRAAGQELHNLPLEALQRGKYQPRRDMDPQALDELAQSIRSQGLMQPVVVRPLEGERYEIIAGERRWRACQLAGLERIPALVREVSDEAAIAMALIENIQREDLNPLEEAQGLQRLTQEFGLTHELAAQAVGRSRSAASNLLRLLQLAEPVQQLLMAGDLDMGHARALLPLDKAQQITTANEIVARKMTVRDAEKRVAQLQGAGRQQPLLRAKAEKPRDVQRLEEQLADRLTAPVEIKLQPARGKHKAQAGQIVIGFGSLDELNGLLDKLGASEG